MKIEISQLAGPRVLVCSCSKLLLQAVHLSLQLSRHMLLVPGELGDTGHEVVLQLDVRSPQHHEVEVDRCLNMFSSVNSRQGWAVVRLRTSTKEG